MWCTISQVQSGGTRPGKVPDHTEDIKHPAANVTVITIFDGDLYDNRKRIYTKSIVSEKRTNSISSYIIPARVKSGIETAGDS